MTETDKSLDMGHEEVRAERKGDASESLSFSSDKNEDQERSTKEIVTPDDFSVKLSDKE